MLREGFYKHNVKESTKRIRQQLDNIDRFVDNDCYDHELIEFIDFIETITKHLKYMLGDKQ